jgi:putative FmdB family regulatory protein
MQHLRDVLNVTPDYAIIHVPNVPSRAATSIGATRDPLLVIRCRGTMPIYEYTCQDCKRRVSLLWRSFADAEERSAACPRCGGANLTRLMSRVAVLRSEDSRMDDLADPGAMGDMDENDPKSLARFMRKMASETGEDLGPEFDEVVGRLEAGEDPETIEQSMPELAAGEGGVMGGDDFGVM